MSFAATYPIISGGGGGGGGVSGVTASSPLASSGGSTPNISISQANGSTNGFLSSADWNTFNNKFDLPALTLGSVLFSDDSTIAQDNTNFFWDNTNKILFLGSFPHSAAPFVLCAQQSFTDPFGQSGIIDLVQNISITANSFSLNAALQMINSAQVATTISGGAAAGVIFNAQRNIGSADDGTLQFFIGAFGGAHQLSTGSNATSNILAGVLSQADIQTGNAGTVADFYGLQGNTSTAGTIGGLFGVYIEPPSVGQKSNWFSGTMQIGGSSFARAASAILDLQSTTGALLVPRMTTTQKNALTAVNGMIVYDTNNADIEGYMGGSWTSMAGGGGGGGANQHLSNLLSATAINQHLLPGVTDGSLNFGSATNYWGEGFIQSLIDTSSALSISVFNRGLYGADGTTISIDWDSRHLVDDSNQRAMNYSTGTRHLIAGDGTSIALQWNDNIRLASGDTTGGTVSFNVNVETGASADPAATASGLISIFSGALTNCASGGGSGGVELTTGGIAGTGNNTSSGGLILATGDNNASGGSTNSGGIGLTTGAVAMGGSRGDIDMNAADVIAFCDNEFGVSAGGIIQLLAAQGIQFQGSKTELSIRSSATDVTLNALTDYAVILNDSGSAGPHNVTFPAGVNGLTFVLGFGFANTAVWTPVPNGGDLIDGNLAARIGNASNRTQATFFNGTWYNI